MIVLGNEPMVAALVVGWLLALPGWFLFYWSNRQCKELVALVDQGLRLMGESAVIIAKMQRERDTIVHGAQDPRIDINLEDSVIKGMEG